MRCSSGCLRPAAAPCRKQLEYEISLLRNRHGIAAASSWQQLRPDERDELASGGIDEGAGVLDAGLPGLDWDNFLTPGRGAAAGAGAGGDRAGAPIATAGCWSSKAAGCGFGV